MIATKQKSKNVPNLRFREFSYEWGEKLIRELLTIGSGRDYKHLKTGDIPVYGTGGLMLYVNDYLYDGKSVCIGRKGTIDKPRFLQGKFWTVDTLFYTYKYKDSIPEFIFLIFQMINWQSYNEASGVPSLSKTTIEKIKTIVPLEEEQKKIAEFIGGVDTKITHLQSKLTTMRDYKKGVMQALFSGKIRFKDENGSLYPGWKEKALGEMFQITSSKRVYESDWKDSGIPFYRTREILSLINGKSIKDPLFITKELYEKFISKYGRIEKGDMLVTGVGTIGKMFLVQDAHQFYFKDGNVIWLKNNPKYSSKFVYYAFQTRLITKQINDNASITTVGTYTIDDAKKTKILVPELVEQKKIADFLTVIDEKIRLEENKFHKSKHFKKALLQEMLV